MLESLRRHIMMQAQGSNRIIGIGGDSIAQILIPTTLPTNYSFLSANLSIEFYIRKEIHVNWHPSIFTYNFLLIGINGIYLDGGYNYVRIDRRNYANQNFRFYIDVSKIIVEPQQITMLDTDGGIISQRQLVGWLSTMNIGGDLILQPNHYISRISAPGYFDLVAAEEGGMLGFRDTLSNIFYGQTNSEGELVALYE